MPHTEPPETEAQGPLQQLPPAAVHDRYRPGIFAFAGLFFLVLAIAGVALIAARAPSTIRARDAVTPGDLAPPSATPQLAASPTLVAMHTLGPTRTGTHAPTRSVPTATDTPVPPTPSATHTPTRSVPTATTASWDWTPRPDSFMPPAEIFLLEPWDGYPLLGTREPTYFMWRYTGRLAPHEAFEVLIWQEPAPPVAAHNAVRDRQPGGVDDYGDGRYGLWIHVPSAAGVRGRQGVYLWTVQLVGLDPYHELGVSAVPSWLIYRGAEPAGAPDGLPTWMAASATPIPRPVGSPSPTTTLVPSKEPTFTPTTLPATLVERESPSRMETNSPYVIRVTLLQERSGYRPTPQIDNQTSTSAIETLAPVGTPAVPLGLAFGSAYRGQVCAKLEGTSFDIQPLGWECLSIDNLPVTWKWQVSPKEEATGYRLHAQIKVDWYPASGSPVPITRVLWSWTESPEVVKPIVRIEHIGISTVLGVVSLGLDLRNVTKAKRQRRRS